MISLEIYVTLLVTIITSGSVAAVNFYIEAKTAGNSRDKTYNNRGFTIIILITVCLIFASTMLYFYNEWSSFVLKSKLFPFHNEYFSGLRFTVTYIVESVISLFYIVLINYTLFYENSTKSLYGYLLKSLYGIILVYGALWGNYFVSYFYVMFIQIKSTILFYIITSVISIILHTCVGCFMGFLTDKFSKFL